MLRAIDYRPNHYSEIAGDKVSRPPTRMDSLRHGVKHGLKKWTTAHAAGLLFARGTLAKFDLDDEAFESVTTAFHDDDKRY